MGVRRFSRTFCAVGIVIAIVVLIAVSMKEREGVSDSCNDCGNGPMTVCLSDEATGEMQSINPTCAPGTDQTSCVDPALHWGLDECGSQCTNTWVQAARGATIEGCFGATSKLLVGINPACQRCVENAGQISNGHVMGYSGGALGDWWSSDTKTVRPSTVSAFRCRTASPPAACNPS
jgi:hypothetical protein